MGGGGGGGGLRIVYLGKFRSIKGTFKVDPHQGHPRPRPY